MKKTKRIQYSLMALTLSAAMIGLSPVSAQEDATVGNSASSLAQMPESKDTTQNALDLLEEALQKDPNPDSARERLCEDLGVSALTDLTYSTPYHYYDFYTQELAVPESGDAYTYWILLYRDGVYCGNLSVTPALGLIQKDLKPYACVETALEQQDDMWFGGAIVAGLPAELVYTGGVIYSLNFGETKTDLVWGQLPHSDYHSGSHHHTGTDPVHSGCCQSGRHCRPERCGLAEQGGKRHSGTERCTAAKCGLQRRYGSECTGRCFSDAVLGTQHQHAAGYFCGITSSDCGIICIRERTHLSG